MIVPVLFRTFVKFCDLLLIPSEGRTSDSIIMTQFCSKKVSLLPGRSVYKGSILNDVSTSQLCSKMGPGSIRFSPGDWGRQVMKGKDEEHQN